MTPQRILIFRFSAMGDVVLLVPVLKSLVAAHPQVQATVVTRPKFSSFFQDITGVEVFKADVDKEYTGVFGLFKLFRKISSKGAFDVVVDMHDHIRTMFLRNLFRTTGHQVVVFEKGRKEKKLLTQKENKCRHPLPHTVQRYQNALAKAGFIFPMLETPSLKVHESVEQDVNNWLSKNGVLPKQERWIGIAPFAMHTSKIWPVENYFEVAADLLKKQNTRFFLFGGGKKEIAYFNRFKEKFPAATIVVAGELKMSQELALMKQLDLMLCVDSSNMHLGSLVGVPLLSIWGGTHTDAGFGPFGKGAESILEVPVSELPCRPCSVYGVEKCYRGDFACLNRITASQVVERINQFITGSEKAN